MSWDGHHGGQHICMASHSSQMRRAPATTNNSSPSRRATWLIAKIDLCVEFSEFILAGEQSEALRFFINWHFVLEFLLPHSYSESQTWIFGIVGIQIFINRPDILLIKTWRRSENGVPPSILFWIFWCYLDRWPYQFEYYLFWFTRISVLINIQTSTFSFLISSDSKYFKTELTYLWSRLGVVPETGCHPQFILFWIWCDLDRWPYYYQS